MAKSVQSRSALKTWLFAMGEDYTEFFITGKHPVLQFVSHAIAWIAWAVIILSFISLLIDHHYLIWLTIIAVLSMVESWHNFKKKYAKK